MVVDWADIAFRGLVAVVSVAAMLAMLFVFHWISKKRYKAPSTKPFCPQCGSVALRFLKKDVEESYFTGSLHSNHSYSCTSCSFSGACPVGSDAQIAEYIATLEKK